MSKTLVTLSPIVLSLCLVACASSPASETARNESVETQPVTVSNTVDETADDDDLDHYLGPTAQKPNINDPFESFNRAMYDFNDVVDQYIAEPISQAYKFITPEFVRTGISNFFSNMKGLNTVLNSALQGKFKQSAESSGRFLVNSSVGLLGLIDVAKHMGLENREEDFEQTLAVWGVPHGPYLVLPIMGPSTMRGIPGAIFDSAANPVTYFGFPAQVVAMLNARAEAEGSLKFIDEAALDRYIFTRESFLQWRDYLAKDGKTVSTTVDPIEDEEDEIAESSDSVTSPSSTVTSSDAKKTTGINPFETVNALQNAEISLKLTYLKLLDYKAHRHDGR